MKKSSNIRKTSVLLTIAALLCSLVTVQASTYYLFQGYNDDPGGWSSKGTMTSEGSHNYSKIITVPSNTSQLYIGVAKDTESCASFTSSELDSGTAQNPVSGVHNGIEVRHNDRCSQGTNRYFILIKSPEPAQMKITYNSSSKLYTVEAYVVTYSVTASLTGTATLSPGAGVAQTVNSGESITFSASEMPAGHKITDASFTVTATDAGCTNVDKSIELIVGPDSEDC